MTSLPSLVRFLKLPYVDVLKMDCEGCEYALPRDVLMEDPTFFHRVGQISLEIHTSAVWVNSTETLYWDWHGLMCSVVVYKMKYADACHNWKNGE